MRWLFFLLFFSVAWAGDPTIDHLQELYKQYNQRAYDYRGEAEKYYSEKEKGAKEHYQKLAKEYEEKAAAVSERIQVLRTGGSNPPGLSPRIEQRQVAEKKAYLRGDEKEQVPCDLQRRMNIVTWQNIPSSTGIGKFPNRAHSKIYPGCATYPPRNYRYPQVQTYPSRPPEDDGN